jgi:hypothetical protein
MFFEVFWLILALKTLGREGGSTPTNLVGENLSLFKIGTFYTIISSLMIGKHDLACSNTIRIFRNAQEYVFW